MTDAVTRESPIMGAPSCTQAAVLKYLLRPKGNYTEIDLENVIIPAYFEHGIQMGVNPVIAIAQVIHETGFLTSWWSNRPRRNPAGIGVTGQVAEVLPPGANVYDWAYDESIKKWRKGLSFESWLFNSVPAHIGRLLGYTLKPKDMTDAQWHYFSLHTARRNVPARVLGCAPTLAGLEGTWAVPGKGYADKLAAHCNRMIEEK